MAHFLTISITRSSNGRQSPMATCCCWFIYSIQSTLPIVNGVEWLVDRLFVCQSFRQSFVPITFSVLITEEALIRLLSSEAIITHLTFILGSLFLFLHSFIHSFIHSPLLIVPSFSQKHISRQTHIRLYFHYSHHWSLPI